MSRFRVLRGRPAMLATLALAALPATTATIQSPATADAAERPRMKPAKPAVPFGSRLILRGQFEGAGNARVQIERRPRGASNWRRVKRTRTGPAGAYRVRVTPPATGRWRAIVLPEGADAAGADSSLGTTAERTSNPARVKVRSRTNAWAVRRHLTVGGRTRVKGRVRPGGRRRVVIRAGGRSVRTRTRPNGRFSARWRAGSGTGSYRVRVRAGANRRATGSRTRAGRVTVYRPASASYYGPGLYGNRTACGRTLSPSTEGVAHKSLPCGTKLRLRYRGRAVTARVIDRGPYAAGRQLDLTYATKRRLGFGSTGTVLMSR